MMTLIAVVLAVAIMLVVIPFAVLLWQIAAPAILILAFILFVPLMIGGLIGYAVSKVREKEGSDD